MVIVGKSQTIPKTAIKFIKENVNIATEKLNLTLKAMQSKKHSILESISNLVVGFIISMLSLYIIFPILAIESSTQQNFIITVYFTLISLIRSYVIRRFFNNKVK